MPIEGSYNKPKEPLGSRILSILIIVAIVITGLIFLFGFVWKDFDPVDFVLNIIGIVLMIGLIFLATKGIQSYLKPKPFSPMEDFSATVRRIAKKINPKTVKDLYLRGEDMRSFAKIGKIEGIGFLPYVTSIPKRDQRGKIIHLKDQEGKIIYNKEWSEAHKEWIQVPKPEMEMIEEKDGDTLFIINKHPFPMSLFSGDQDLIRCHKKYHSSLVGDVFIKAVNLVPIGEYLYPNQQWQTDMVKVMKEDESKAVIQTHRNFLDLVSNVTQMSLGADPTFQKIMLAQSERLSTGLGGNNGNQ